MLLVSPSSLHGVELLEGWSLQQNEQRDCWPCQLVHCILNETMDGQSILSLISLLDRIRSGWFHLMCVHGLVPGILGTGKNHFGPEHSPWILIRIRKLQLPTSRWNLYFGFSKRRSRARQRRTGSFWFFQRTWWMAGVLSILNLGTAGIQVPRRLSRRSKWRSVSLPNWRLCTHEAYGDLHHCPIQAPCRKPVSVYRGIRHFEVLHPMVLFSHNRLWA